MNANTTDKGSRAKLVEDLSSKLLKKLLSEGSQKSKDGDKSAKDDSK